MFEGSGDSARREPLHRHPVLRSDHPDDVQAGLARLYQPHRLRFHDARPQVDAIINAADIAGLGLVYNTLGGCRYGIDTHHGVPADVVMVNFPGGGAATLRQKGETAQTCRATAAVIDGGVPFEGIYDAYAPLIAVVAKDDLHRLCRDLLGDRFPGDVDFQLGCDLTSHEGRLLWGAAAFLARQLNGDGFALAAPFIAARTKEWFLSLLLGSQPSNVRGLLHQAEDDGILPYHVKRARDYIHAHPDRPITLGELARVAGCTGRTLQIGFRRYLDDTPLGYLARVRLRRVRQELIDGDAGTSVGEVAARWGMPHGGRFARAYLAAFGEHPSETRRRHSATGLAR